MKRIAQAVLWVTLTIPGTAFAADPRGNFAVIGTGDVACAEYTTEQSTGGADQFLAEAEVSWVQGFLTAYNVYVPTVDGDITSTTTAGAVKGWLSSYCARHPLYKIVIAATELVAELKARKH